MNNSQFPDLCPVPPRMEKVGQSGTRIGVLATCGYNFCHFCQRSGVTRMFSSSLRVYHTCQALFFCLFELPRSLDRGSRPSKSARRRPGRQQKLRTENIFWACPLAVRSGSPDRPLSTIDIRRRLCRRQGLCRPLPRAPSILWRLDGRASPTALRCGKPQENEPRPHCNMASRHFQRILAKITRLLGCYQRSRAA